MLKAQLANNLEMMNDFMDEKAEYFRNLYQNQPAYKIDSLMEATRDILERDLYKYTEKNGFFLSKTELRRWVDEEVKNHKREMLALADEYEMDYD